MLPFSMKPIFGWMSDYVPIFGYNKSPYVIMVTIPSVIFLSLLAFSPKNSLALMLVVFGLFCVFLQISLTDLLSEARYAEAMRVVPLRGPDLMTYVWFGISVGGLVATLVVGPLLEHFGPEMCFAVCIIPAALIFFPTALGWFEERRQTSEEVRAKRDQLCEQKEITFLVGLLAVSTLSMLAVALF